MVRGRVGASGGVSVEAKVGEGASRGPLAAAGSGPDGGAAVGGAGTRDDCADALPGAIASRYCATRPAGSRPRSPTGMPLSRAQARTAAAEIGEVPSAGEDGVGAGAGSIGVGAAAGRNAREAVSGASYPVSASSAR